jgi:PAS domain-containing protein
MSAHPHLVALPGYAGLELDIHFCSHCGAHAGEDGSTPVSRVCGRCGLGLLIAASPTVAPDRGQPFLLVDGTLTTSGLSREAEKLLGVSEADALHQRITDLLLPADCEAAGADSLIHTLVSAARGDALSAEMVVRPTREFGIRYWARIGSCGPPKGALVVLQDGLR